MVGVFVAFIRVVYGRTIYMSLPYNQRTSGPVNVHMTPGPGIYFNAFILGID